MRNNYENGKLIFIFVKATVNDGRGFYELRKVQLVDKVQEYLLNKDYTLISVVDDPNLTYKKDFKNECERFIASRW